jgi:hypothetical protein
MINRIKFLLALRNRLLKYFYFYNKNKLFSSFLNFNNSKESKILLSKY